MLPPKRHPTVIDLEPTKDLHGSPFRGYNDVRVTGTSTPKLETKYIATRQIHSLKYVRGGQRAEPGVNLSHVGWPIINKKECFLMKWLSALLCLALIVGLMPVDGFAATVPDNRQLFQQALTADGAVAEQLARLLGSEFEGNPTSFVKELALATSEQVKAVSRLLAYNASYGDLGQYEQQVQGLRSDASLSKTEVEVLDELLNAVKEIRKGLSSSEPSGQAVVPKPRLFLPETILKHIEAREAAGLLGQLDEEYCYVLANAYCLDPELFAKTISALAPDTIASVTKAVGYGLKLNRKQPQAGMGWELTQQEKEILDSIKSSIDTVSVEFAEAPGATSGIVYPASTQVPTIGPMVYTTSPLRVGETETLRVEFSETARTDIARSYWVEVYGVRNGTPWLKASKYVSIPAGQSSVYEYFNMTFSSTGPFYTLVKVYSDYQGTLLTQRQGAYPDTVYGYWQIDVLLPKNRDYKGTLYLYRAEGDLVSSCECLGRSVYNTSMWEVNGNTPTGTYTGYLDGPCSPSSSYGPYKVINMTGVSGVIVQSGRSGIWIHGGDRETDSSRPWYPLRPTYGCVRISNDDQEALQNSITSLVSDSYHYSTGYIYISEY